MLVILAMIILRAFADLWRMSKFIMIEKRASKIISRYKKKNRASLGRGKSKDYYDFGDFDKNDDEEQKKPEKINNLPKGPLNFMGGKNRALTGISVNSDEGEIIPPDGNLEWGIKVMDLSKKIHVD